MPFLILFIILLSIFGTVNIVMYNIDKVTIVRRWYLWNRIQVKYGGFMASKGLKLVRGSWMYFEGSDYGDYYCRVKVVNIKERHKTQYNLVVDKSGNIIPNAGDNKRFLKQIND